MQAIFLLPLGYRVHVQLVSAEKIKGLLLKDAELGESKGRAGAPYALFMLGAITALDRDSC